MSEPKRSQAGQSFASRFSMSRRFYPRCIRFYPRCIHRGLIVESGAEVRFGRGGRRWHVLGFGGIGGVLLAWLTIAAPSSAIAAGAFFAARLVGAGFLRG
jgi:hypothetical protein